MLNHSYVDNVTTTKYYEIQVETQIFRISEKLSLDFKLSALLNWAQMRRSAMDKKPRSGYTFTSNV